ncbi:MAG: eukaryotic-like serine/threonine-protein kinase [Blastocatellia bacterium]|jgi:serine/threonine protein kinase|nr:eukaryotic-like serine/threonine-protein kinase [Blastocatellia bacterium]
MTPKRWQRINELFHAALVLDGQERSAFLVAQSAGDDALRAKVAALLTSHDQAEGFIQGSVFGNAAQLLVEDEAQAMIGQHIGLYKINREIGRGGMGTVYLATRDDNQYQKQVAIKVVKRGMDTDLVLARFRNERQILAGFDHPNIARLFDGGSTETGLPYFIMEYIEGLPIDGFCDTQRLATAARLELFRTVCAAVQYAHQHLVIHRDIKPSNILVTAEGLPKLLDFGIAKLLHSEATQRTATTGMLQRLMTPEYASPEQVLGEHVTTVSDVYSLGVLLYELLSGHSPYRFKTLLPQDIAQVISDSEPEKPSTVIDRVEEVTTGGRKGMKLTPESVSKTRDGRPEKLRRKLAGDLDNIVLMAMRKEPSRRYSSVGQFSEDIRRHLEGLPVLARKATLSYRATKFVRRNTVAVAAAAVISLIVIVGIAAIGWEAHVARGERARAEAAGARAERRFNQVRKLAHSVLFDYNEAIQDLPGSMPVRERLVKDALEYLDSLAGEANDDPSLQRELATAYEKVGDVQGRTLRANMGDTAGARESYRKALRIRETLVAGNPKDASTRGDLADSYREFGRLLWKTSDTAGGLENARREVVLREALAAEDPTNMQARFNLGVSHADVGEILLEQGGTTGAAESLGRALTIFEALLAAEPSNEKYRLAVPFVYGKSSEVMLWQGNAVGALAASRQALTQDSKLSIAYPMNAHYREELGIDFEKVGNGQENLGDINGALESYGKELQIFAEQSATDPENAQFRSDLSSAYLKVGNMLARIGKPVDALVHQNKALVIREEAARADPLDLWKRWDLIESYAKTSDALAKDGNAAASLDACRKTQALLADTIDDPTNVYLRSYRAYASADVGEALMIIAASNRTALSDRRGLRDAAEALYKQSAAIWEGMRKNGTLSSPDALRFDRLTREIAESHDTFEK